MKNKLITIILIILTVFSLIYIGDVKEAVTVSIRSCVFGIIPSLYAMCVLATASVSSGAFDGFTSKVSRSPKSLSALIFGNTGGYPIGAKLIKDMADTEKISKSEAEKMICFSFSSGPAFCLGLLSKKVFGSVILGIGPVLSVFLSNLVIYFIVKPKNESAVKMKCNKLSFTDELIEAVGSSSYAMIAVSSAIVFFSVIRCLIKNVIPFISELTFFDALLEISNIADLECKGVISYGIISAILAFGGICVHMQIKSIVKDSFSLRKFYATRPAHIALTALFSALYYFLVTRYLPASASPKLHFSQSQSVIPFICLILMIAISIKYKNRHTS